MEQNKIESIEEVENPHDQLSWVDIVNAIKDPVTKFLFEKAMSGLKEKFAKSALTSWLNWAMPNWLVGQALYFVIRWGFVETKLIVIKFEKRNEREAFDSAKDNYDKAKESNNEEEIKKREQELIDSFRKHIKFG